MSFDGKIKVGIVGAAGYTAGELLRILVNHPAAEVVFAQSGSHAGEPVWSAHADLLGETNLRFVADLPPCTSDPLGCNVASDGVDCCSDASLRSAPPFASLRSAPVPPLNVPRVAVSSPTVPPSPDYVGGNASGRPFTRLGREAQGDPRPFATDGKTSGDEGTGVQLAQPDVLFLCSGHGKSKGFVHEMLGGYKGAIIDLSNDFRLEADAEDFVYGLPEAFRDKITGARHIANPGCFATAIQLALLPAAKADILPEVHVTGITGSTGAGQAPSATTHFSWRADNLSVYKAFTHQHLGEIKETLHKLAPSFGGDINFVPVRGDFTRGILASVYFDCDLSEEEAVTLYKDYYMDEPFVHVIDSAPDLKMVVNTNKCVLGVRKHGRKLHVISVIDNLVKGASGQAVQNMNLLFGLPEGTGLHLKGTRF